MPRVRRSFVANVVNSFAQGSYSTNFANAENPLYERGIWYDGGAGGAQDWTNPLIVAGRCVGQATGIDDDSVGVLVNGPYAVKQYAEAVVSISGSAGADAPELELFLQVKGSAHTWQGYECNWNMAGVMQVVRWNGPYNNFTVLTLNSGTSPGNPSNGDVFRARYNNVGPTIELIVNSTVVETYSTAAEFTLPAGNPGLGFYTQHIATAQVLGASSYNAGAW